MGKETYSQVEIDVVRVEWARLIDSYIQAQDAE